MDRSDNVAFNERKDEMRKFFLFVLFVMAATVVCHAASMYTSYTDWASAVTIAGNDKQYGLYGNSINRHELDGLPVTLEFDRIMRFYRVSNENLFWFSYNDGESYGGNQILHNTEDDIKVTFSAPVQAFGFQANSWIAGEEFLFELTLSDGSVLSQQHIEGNIGASFFGFVSIDGIDSFTLTGLGYKRGGFAIANFVYGYASDIPEDANTVPEPSTMLLLGSGLVCLFGIARRRISAKK